MDIEAIERDKCIRFILREQESGQLKKEVTAYYGYFVAKAICKQSNSFFMNGGFRYRFTHPTIQH